jgi:hypothetical protein
MVQWPVERVLWLSLNESGGEWRSLGLKKMEFSLEKIKKNSCSFLAYAEEGLL